ncbi:hypothetical protein [Streptomyces sp. AC495_CC817]|uniref:hypothetical protein n=1 Tax=Streptomyces sp. AC495_CC817 TaxID=2823900 RepID=UPI001C253D37|nr:hypothetical protein [Streptomyces sp. AC495_CC817]
MSNETLDDLLAGGGKTAKFERPGQTWSGVVTKAEPRQATNFDTGKPDFWEDGQPKMQAVVSIQTDLREDETDDGVRAIYIKMWGDQKKAFRLAAQQAGGAPQPGDTFTATYYADGEKPQRGFAPKLFRYEIKKASALDAALGVHAPAASAPTQAAPAAVAAPAVDPQFEERVRTLIGKSLDDDSIASVIEGATPDAVHAIRLRMAAANSNGF